MRPRLAGTALVLATALASPGAPRAEVPDKNGVAPTVISLPAGPGSIDGLGEAFQPMLNTGMANYAVPIPLPAGTNGQTPQLVLRYDGGEGHGPAGLGWKFGPGGIGRQTDKGLPRYVDGPNLADDDRDGLVDEFDETDTFVGPDGEELVDLGDGTWRARIEGSFARYRRVGDGWESDRRDGSRLEFGLTPEGRVSDSAGTRVFRWLLERSTDVNGNTIEYRWTSFPGSPGQKYLAEIRYGPGAPPWPVFRFASFAYEERPDPRDDFRAGFLVRTLLRLSRIDVGIQGTFPDTCAVGDHNADGAADALTARFTVDYDAAHPRHSLLAGVTRFGADGVNRLPPVSFAYATFEPPLLMSAAGAVIGSENAPPTVMDSGLAELADLNRDGLPDILRTDLQGGAHTVSLNLGQRESGGRRVIRWDEAIAVASADGLALALHLAEDRISLADLDGDGLSDLAHYTEGGEVHYYPNRGAAEWGARVLMDTAGTAPPAPFTRSDVAVSDLDFDKRTDVILSTETGYSVWFNLDGEGFSREVRTPGARHQGRVMLFSDAGMQMADMNGDRLNDAARVTPTAVVYAPASGYGGFEAPVELPIPDVVLTDGEGGQIERARLADLDGDGLTDLAVERAEPGQLWFWLNEGNGSFSRRHVVTDLPTVFGEGTAVRWADMNGNGTTDLVWADSSADDRVRVLDVGLLAGGSSHPNLLTGIDNGLGMATSLTWESSTAFYLDDLDAGDPWTTTIPFPVQVVSGVETSTGLDVDGDPGLDVYFKEYRYRDGFYEDREKAFRGFASVEVTEPGDATAPTRVGRHGFFTGGPDGVDNDGDGETDEVSPEGHREEEALKGMAATLETRSETGTVFSREENDWRVRNLLVSPDGIEVRFASNARRDRVIVEGTDTPETLRTDFTYDDFGNLAVENSQGALSIAGDEVVTLTDHINDTSRWIVGKPWRRRVTDGSGTKVSETFHYYDGEDFVGLPSGSLARGNLTRSTGWVAGDDYVDLVRHARDDWGNVTASLSPNGFRRSATWDALLRSFAVREDVEVGGGMTDLIAAAEYNLGLGTITAVIGFDGQRTEFGYDVFGRLTSTVSPGDSAAYPTKVFAYVLSDPVGGLTWVYDADGNLTLTPGPAGPSFVRTGLRESTGEPGTFDSLRYVDGLGRPLATLTEGESGFVASGAVLSNARGAVRRTSPPYATASDAYAAPLADDPATEYHYDAAGREVLRINPPDSLDTLSQVSTEFLPLRRTVTDELGKRKTFIEDGLGRVVETREENGAETYVTSWSYDPLGRLTGTLDALGNSSSRTYDGLGRLVLVEDPDRGRTSYRYDAAGNLLGTTDNKGQTVMYSYDGADRLLAEHRLDGPVPARAAAWHYDDPSDAYPSATNTRGRLSWVEDLSGARFMSYDERGNVDWWVRRIVDEGLVRDHLSRSSYDAMGRPVSSVFPDGDRVEYVYNSRALLESIPGIVTGIDYHPSGAIESITYGNGVRTDYSFDPRDRMTALLTNPALPGDPLQSLAYTLDGASNVTAIDDLRSLAPADPSNATQLFAYDDLHRLARAEGPGYGVIDFGHDPIGNLVFASSPDSPDPKHIPDPLVNLGDLAYGGGAGTSGRGPRLPEDPPGPHAVTGTQSGLAFDYDDNGNLSANGADSYEWDFKDRLTEVLTASADARYVYDFSGRRVIKRVSRDGVTSRTYYVDPGYEIREGRPVKYVFAGGRRVASVEGRLSDGGGSQTLSFQPGWNFFSLEVEPGDPAVESVLASLSGSWTGVWAWDAAGGEYVGWVPSQGIYDLTELHSLKGYLIRVTEACELMISGAPAAGNVVLEAGWNLAAATSENALPVTEAFNSPLVEAVWGYDTGSRAWSAWMPSRPAGLEPLDTVEPARAYWVKVSGALALSRVANPTRITWYHPDHLGSSSLTTDADGAEVERTEFYPFGRIRHRQGPGPAPDYRFTGKEQDAESGLDYFGARYYLPVTGSFISVDPLPGGAGDAGSLNPYAYARGNPLGSVDPDGREDVPVVGDVAAWKKIEAQFSRNREFQAMLKRLGNQVTISVVPGSKQMNFDPNTMTINVDPTMGAVMHQGRAIPIGYASPARGAAHEVAHAVSYVENPNLQEAHANREYSSFVMSLQGRPQVREEHTLEEQQAVDFENSVASRLGWFQRPGYTGGIPVSTASPTATEMTPEMTVEWAARRGRLLAVKEAEDLALAPIEYLPLVGEEEKDRMRKSIKEAFASAYEAAADE